MNINVKCEIDPTSCVIEVKGFASQEKTVTFALAMRAAIEAVLVQMHNPSNDGLAPEGRMVGLLVNMLFEAADALVISEPDHAKRMGLLCGVVCSTIATIYPKDEQFDILDKLYHRCGPELGRVDLDSINGGLRGMAPEGNA